MLLDYSTVMSYDKVPQHLQTIPVVGNTFDLTSVLNYLQTKQYTALKEQEDETSTVKLIGNKLNEFTEWLFHIGLPAVETLTPNDLKTLQVNCDQLTNSMDIFNSCIENVRKSAVNKSNSRDCLNVCVSCDVSFPLAVNVSEWEIHEHNCEIRTVAKSVVRKSLTTNKEHVIIESLADAKGKLSFLNVPVRYYPYIDNIVLKNEDCLFCHPCETNIYCDPFSLIQHIETKLHVTNTGIEMFHKNYWCSICKITIQDDPFKWHHHLNSFVLHAKRCKSLKDVREYDCLTCNLVMFCDRDVHKNHAVAIAKEAKQIKARKRNKDLPSAIKSMFKSTSKLEAEITKLLSDSETEDQTKCNQFLNELQQTLRNNFPDCQLHTFGSRVNGLGDRESDLDVFMDIDSTMYNGGRKQDSKSQFEIVETCIKTLRLGQNRRFVGIQGVPMARTPIVKVLHPATKLRCDLSFRHGLSVDNTRFIRLCIQLQPKVRPLILILKKWSAILRLRTHITNYAFCILAIFYFQTKKHLPSVSQIRERECVQNNRIEGWPIINYEHIDVDALRLEFVPCLTSMHQVLLDFFTYYINFAFTEDVVCPLLGTTVKKTIFHGDSLENLPLEMESYREHVIDVDNPEIFRYNSAMCVQDPFELLHNLTKAVPQHCVDKFRAMCKLSLQHLINCKKE